MSADRRTLLRGMGIGAAAMASGGAAALLAACSGSSAGEGSATSSTEARAPLAASSTALPAVAGSAASTAQRFDPSVPFWEQGAFRAVTEEVAATTLEIEGSLPPELSGVFLRNGSNPQGGTSPHWFLGDGMVHGVRLDRGKASWYRNRWVRTPFFLEHKGFGGIPGTVNSQSNVSVVRHGGRVLTSGEIGWPYEIDPSDLSTVGPHDFAGRLGPSMTAHPKVDPATGAMHFFGYNFAEPFLTYYVADPSGELVVNQNVEVGRSTMIHDFAITESDVIFWEGPVLFGADGGLEGMPFGWDASYGFRFGVMPLGGPTSAIRWVEMDPQFIFHGVNAHRDGDEVVLCGNRLESVFVKGQVSIAETPSFAHRWRIDTSGSELSVRAEQLSDIVMDLPTHDRRHTGRPTRHAWFATTETTPEWGFEFAGICHMDLETGTTRRWEPGRMERAGEGCFVPSGKAEGEGWLLTYAYDRTTDRSSLAVLDAQDVGRGPVARVRLPERVPFGFHGLWVADD